MKKKLGSENKFTKNSREDLHSILEPHFKELGKELYKLSLEERQLQLKAYAKILTSGSDELAIKTKEVIYKSLNEHFKKMRFYFPHLAPNKKASELRQFLKMLPAKQIEHILTDMGKRQNIKFR